MPYQLWSQDNFSKGELSPFMYARAQVNQYYDGLKTAQNVLTYPTGAAGKRFGTLYESTLTGFTAFNQIYFDTFQFLDECVYQLLFVPQAIKIYLEGILLATVVTTLDGHDVYNMSTTVLGAAFRVSGDGFKPYDLTRSDSAPATINGISANSFTVAGGPVFTLGVVGPIQFFTTGSLPVTTPQIKLGVTYFGIATGTNTFKVYLTSYDAKFGLNELILTNIGTGTNTYVVRNVWAFNHVTFKNVPVYDFIGGYDAVTFTPGTSGGLVTVTASSPIFISEMEGGAFIGNGGIGRITRVATTSTIVVAMQTPFASLDVIQGSLAFLAEPAWSDLRGWPRICSSYQNRALFANTVSLPNGFYTSVVNDYTDFDDLNNDDDSAISWYPSSNDVNVIRFIVPFRSVTVHTNSGIYSSPLSEISAITPSTFTLQLQDSTPADVLEPQAIDNQIIVLSGNDAHTMLWDGINNAYTSNIVSIVSEQLIRDPVDERSFADLRRAGSRYVFIINSNGTMAIYQTLQSESVSGFTPAIMEQSYGSAQFLQAASSFDGRCWFVVQRQIAQVSAGINLTAFTSSTLTAVASNFSTTIPTAVTFTTTGLLPAATPVLNTTSYFWVIGVTADTFHVYLDQDDALAAVNALVFSSFGNNSKVVAWPLVTIFTLEELSQDVHLDCAVYYNGSPASTISTGALFNAQNVKMIGDGFGFDAIGFNNQVNFQSHGSSQAVSVAYIGFPINLIIEPMPLTPPPGPQSTLTKPKHIRSVRFMFNNTIGGTINGVPIALEPFDMANIGFPPFPGRGIFEMSIMQGWDDFNIPTFTIEHSDPFNIELIGVFYSVDV